MHCFKTLLILVSLGFSLNALTSFGAAAERGGDQAQYYKKWIEEDVAYIITDEEKDAFKSLNNDEEREIFIEDFWRRRNPDPRSSYNSFREEHYRRIAYANQHYHSGIPGWKTDRGRIYIMYGQPDQLETHPTGGTYDRPTYEGGGTTTVYAFEKWWYRHIDGLGDDIEIEFVDRSMSNEYRMAMSPDEKDALLNVPNAGLTLAEQYGLVSKADRGIWNPNAMNTPGSIQHSFLRAKDSPFSRMEQYFGLQRAPEIKFEDLKSVVTTKITYNTLPFDLRTDYMKLSANQVLVPITIELNNENLEFKKELGFNRAAVNVYGIITSLTNRIAAEWEAEIAADFSDESFEMGKNRRSEYQHIVALPPGQRYKLDLVLKDINSEEMGSLSIPLIIPRYEDDGSLQSSTIILANSISSAPKDINRLQQFIIGDMKVVPNVTAEYRQGDNLIPYMQIYNMQIDQASQEPSLDIAFVIKRDGKVVREIQTAPQNSEKFFYGRRVILLGKIPLTDFSPGDYSLEIRVLDSISKNTITTSTDFKIKERSSEILSMNP